MRFTQTRTFDDFWSRCENKRRVAETSKDTRKQTIEAWEATGMALEFAFKAAIWKRERLNRWPDSGPLHTHDLKKLFDRLGIDHATIPPSLRASLKSCFAWKVEHRYSRDRVPRKAANDFYNAAFDENGVVQWLKSL